IEFLQLIKQDKRLLAIPVIVLTTSRSEQDKLDSFQLGVAGYMIKSVNYPDFVEMIRKLKDYWDVSELPI
ncbi:MAG TPA: response regulator, partial [Candidatus Cloacimonadota bacterium]|nr:response regulator [Candidatus Cloacimonadota bacterium]